MTQNTRINKYLHSSEAKLKYKKQCLKAKNILYENDCVQIGCKLTGFYDFYSSKNFIQMQMFVGNKTQKKIQNFNIHYKGTPNLELYLQKKANIIAQNTQYKERSIVGCNNYNEEILLLLDFSSEILTLKSTPIPVSLFSFFSFLPPSAITIPLTSSFSQLTSILSEKYQYTQELELSANVGIFKKGLLKDIPKFFTNLVQHTDNVYAGEFSLQDLTDEYGLVLLVKDEMKMKVTLCGKEYKNFDWILGELRFLLCV